MNHYEWKAAFHTCPGCGWAGPGSDTRLGETFADGAEYHCPNCDHRFGYVAFPLLSETLAEPRAPAGDRLFAQLATGPASKVPDLSGCQAAVQALARRHRGRLWAWFLMSLLGGNLLMWLAQWANSHRGWESQVIYFMFLMGGGVLLLSTLFFGAALWGWYKLYRSAVESAEWYGRDPQSYKQAYREVLGPIPW